MIRGLLLFSWSLLLCPKSYAYYRGQKLLTFDSRRGSTRSRYLMNNDQSKNSDIKGVDSVTITASPVAPVALSLSPAPLVPIAITKAPITDIITPTLWPSQKPTSSRMSSNSPINKEGSRSPTESRDESPFMEQISVINVDLLDFVVSSTNESSDTLTRQLASLLSRAFDKEFKSFLQIKLQLSEQQNRMLQEELKYSGTASFSDAVWNQDVQSTQQKTLEKIDEVIKVAPTIVSISILSALNTVPPAEAPANSASLGIIAGMIVVAVIIMVVGVMLAIRYFRYFSYNEDEENLKGVNTQLTVSEPSTPRDAFRDENQSVATKRQGIEADEYSLDGFSMTESEHGVNKTEQFLIRRMQIKKQKQGPDREMDQSDSDNGDASDTDFSYDYVGRKNLESDDDPYVTDSEAVGIEVGLDGNAAIMTGYFGSSGNSKRLPELSSPPTKLSSQDISFDEPEELPFDEQLSSEVAKPDAKTSRVIEDAAIIANQIQYERDDEISDDDYHKNRNPTQKSRKGKDEETEDLTSFLRGRRNAKRQRIYSVGHEAS
jgi:hypothetical protein